ncbi:Reticulon-4 [Manis javanica]|nr:Reticulon-4 [Manis javanica]
MLLFPSLVQTGTTIEQKYVDDILVATEDQERCLQGTKDLLSTLGALGYRAQICKTETPTSLNPATLLPDLDWEAPLHDCGEILAHVHGVRTDLRDQPLAEADATWYTDGSSFMQDRVSVATNP